ncbi:MAG: restriction endonuclease subunit S [Deltaproteobacteria bacterium]|nr:restriction endonuclease subunit S [Deltaproteobacteria bacterium]
MKEILEQTKKELHIDRTGWKLVKFSDVAIQQKESVDREKTDITRYIKGEHMSSEDLHLREWGELKDEYLGPAFIRKFEKGDILYGSRRTYLRKVTIAPFEGITSNTTFVIKANENLIHKKLLPFVMLSEGFSEHSIRNSKGSVNPYINWKDIANYEFLLPPKDQQAQLAELLWAMDEVIEKEVEVLENAILLRDINREKLYTYGINALKKNESTKTKNGKIGLIRADFNEIKFFDCVEIKSGQVDPTKEEYANLYQIGSERIEANTGRITELKTAKELNITSGNYLFSEDDIIYSKIRPYFKKVANPNFKGLCSADIYPLRVKVELISKEYLFYYLLTEKFTRKLLRFQNRTGMPKVNRDELGSMYIPYPNKDEQKEIVKILQKIDETLNSNQNKINSSKSLQKSLINQVF